MIYYRQNIDSFNEGFENHSVIVIVSENYNSLLKDAKKISEAIAGKNADVEMRVSRYFSQEIVEKKRRNNISIENKKLLSWTTSRNLKWPNGKRL